MKLEILIIKDDEYIIHKSVSTVYEDSNPYNVAIQAIIEQLTGIKPANVAQAGAIPLTKPIPMPAGNDKFAQAVPDYKPPVESAAPTFHPDLVKQGVAPAKPVLEKGIPTIKLDMKTILKDKK